MVKAYEYWTKKLKLLEVIKKDNGKSPLSSVVKGIYSVGTSLYLMLDEMEAKGLIVVERYDRITKTCVTHKGDKMIRILNELKEVWGNED